MQQQMTRPKKTKKNDSLAAALRCVEDAARELEKRDGTGDPLVVALRLRAARLRATP